MRWFFKRGLAQVQQVQVYVQVQPVAPVIVRPAAPAPGHIWVEHEWVVRNGAYVHVPGYWAVASARTSEVGSRSLEKSSGHGYYWVPGHWT